MHHNRSSRERVLPLVGDEDFCLIFGDGVADVDIRATIEFHRASGRLATVTAMRQPGQFGAIRFENDMVTGFEEKPIGDGGWVFRRLAIRPRIH